MCSRDVHGRFSTNPCPRRRSGCLPRPRRLPASARSAESTRSRSGSRFPHRSCRTGANRDPPRRCSASGLSGTGRSPSSSPECSSSSARWSSTASGTLGATQLVDEEIVLHVAHANDVGDDSLRHATLAVRPDAPIERDDMVVNRHRDVGEVQTAMFSETIPNESPQLICHPDRRRRRCSRNHAPCVTSPRSSDSACPAGRRRYRKNRYETPNENPRLFVQSLFAWRWVSTLDAVAGGDVVRVRVLDLVQMIGEVSANLQIPR